MSNTRNGRLLWLRNEPAAVGSWLGSTRTAAAIVSSCFGTALPSAAMAIDDPGGGPGG